MLHLPTLSRRIASVFSRKGRPVTTQDLRPDESESLQNLPVEDRAKLLVSHGGHKPVAQPAQPAAVMPAAKAPSPLSAPTSAAHATAAESPPAPSAVVAELSPAPVLTGRARVAQALYDSLHPSEASLTAKREAEVANGEAKKAAQDRLDQHTVTHAALPTNAARLAYWRLNRASLEADAQTVGYSANRQLQEFYRSR